MFCPNFSIITAPLTALTGKDIPFKWGPKQKEAQDKLITLITSAPILARPDPDKQFKLETDTSQVGTGAILYQRDPPITKPDSTQKPGPREPVGFHSQKFTQTEQNYPIYDRKFLGIMRGLCCWSHLLKGTTIPVLVYTDHANLRYYREPRKIGPRVAGYLPEHECYNPPYFSPPLYPSASTPKPLAKPLPVLPPLPPSNPSKDATTHLPMPVQPPVEPLVPIPWNIHHKKYFSMEMYQEPPPVENPLEDPDSPMEDAPPLEPEPVTHYEPDVPGGQMHTLSPEESPIEPWQAYLTQPSSPISHKHSLSPTSPSSAPIRQCTSREGSYQSITPAALSPTASTSPQSQGHQSTSSEESADNPSSTHSSAEDVDSDMALNWVTIKSDYHKG